LIIQIGSWDGSEKMLLTQLVVILLQSHWVKLLLLLLLLLLLISVWVLLLGWLSILVSLLETQTEQEILLVDVVHGLTLILLSIVVVEECTQLFELVLVLESQTLRQIEGLLVFWHELLLLLQVGQLV
jgi:hypothetical protein